METEEGQRDSRHASRIRWSSDLPYYTPGRIKARLTAWYLTKRAQLIRKRQPQEAERLFRRAIALIETAIGPDFPGIVEPLIGLGYCLHDRREFTEGRQTFERVATIYRGEFGQSGQLTAWAETWVASCLIGDFRPEEADLLLHPALPIYERVFGRDSAEVAYVLTLLGMAARRQDAYAESLSYLERALAIRKRGFRHAGIKWTTYELAVSKARFGIHLAVEAQLDEADAALGQAFQLARSIGREEDLTLLVEMGLGMVRDQQWRLKEAEIHFRNMYEYALENKEGASARVVAAGYLAGTLRKQARFTEGFAILEQVINSLDGSLPADALRDYKVTLLRGLFEIEFDANHMAQAAGYAEAALGLLTTSDPAILDALRFYAAALDRQGRCADSYRALLRLMAVAGESQDDHQRVSELRALGYFGPNHGRLDAEAAEALQLALAVWEKSLEPDDYRIGWSLVNLAEYLRRHDLATSVTLFERGMAILIKAFDEDDPELVKYRVDFASALMNSPQRNSDRAEQILSKARAVAESVFGSAHPTFSYVLSGVAERHELLGEVELAVEEWQESIAITEKLCGTNDDVVQDLYMLAPALAKLGRSGEAAAAKERADKARIVHQDLEPRFNFDPIRSAL